MEDRKPALSLIPPLPELRARYAQAVEDVRVLERLCKIAERAAIERNQRCEPTPSGGRSGR